MVLVFMGIYLQLPLSSVGIIDSFSCALYCKDDQVGKARNERDMQMQAHKMLGSSELHGECCGYPSLESNSCYDHVCVVGSVQVYYVAATLIASLLEAFTVQSDNVFVPILYAALLMLHSKV
jgi:hypothetical protein